MGILDFLPLIGKILDRIIPDPAAKAQAQLQLMQMQQAGDFKQLDADLQVALAQTKVDEAEANSGSDYKDWRVLVGYGCGFGMVYNFVLSPFLGWISTAFLHVAAPPVLDISQMMPVLLGMLGLGSMHTVENVKANGQ